MKTATEPVYSKYFANGSEKRLSRGKNRYHRSISFEGNLWLSEPVTKFSPDSEYLIKTAKYLLISVIVLS